MNILDMPEHYTVDRRLDDLVTAFINKMKGASK